MEHIREERLSYQQVCKCMIITFLCAMTIPALIMSAYAVSKL